MNIKDDLTQAQKILFEECVSVAVNCRDCRMIATITESVSKDLLSLREPWASALARDRVLWKKVYTVLKRLTERGEIDKGEPSGKFATWGPKLVGHEGVMIIDDPEEATTDEQRERIQKLFTERLPGRPTEDKFLMHTIRVPAEPDK